MKRALNIFLLSLITLSCLSALVSAETVSQASWVTSLKETGNEMYSAIAPVLEFVTGETSGSGTLFLAKVLLIILIFSVVWVALSKIQVIEDTGWAHLLASIAVAILTIRFIGDSNVINTIILPYSAFGIAVTSIIPFLVYFYVVKDFKRSGRKMAWILFAVVFFGLWIGRYDATENNLSVGKFSWIYVVTGILSLAMLWFDGTIQRYMKKSEHEDISEINLIKRSARIRDEEFDLEDRIARGVISDAGEIARLREDIKRRKKLLGLPA